MLDINRAFDKFAEHLYSSKRRSLNSAFVAAIKFVAAEYEAELNSRIEPEIERRVAAHLAKIKAGMLQDEK